MKLSWVFFCILMASSVFARGGGTDPVQTVPFVDLNQYVGTWYEVASIPQRFQKDCVANTTAEYSLLNNGLVKVINSCETQTGKRKTVEGRAKVVDKNSNAKLKVTFVKIFKWIFAFGGNYWILDLDNDYSYAVVGDPTRKYAWILSRSPDISLDKLHSANAKLISNGYDTCKVLTSVQAGGFNERRPLCEIVKSE